MIQPFKFLKDYIAELNAKGGPVEADYYDLDKWLRQAQGFGPTQSEVEEIFGNELLNPLQQGKSLLGRIFYRPRGYAGSYDIMEDLYTDNLNPTIPGVQMAWDAFLLSQVSTVAVKHRLEVLRGIALNTQDKLTSFLDVACGSGIAHTILQNRPKNVELLLYVGVDQDADAIEFCRKTRNVSSVQFKQHSLLGLTRKELGNFDLVWCSGLFDYIGSREGFIGGARRLVRLADKVVIIGNMGPYNPSRALMELLFWKLEYRTRAELRYLGDEIKRKEPKVARTYVKTDPTGIQHYLYIEKK
jgi:extracellular factor (EF) 3-hydroxypalmitic acid methyl ester biosynthesis protein